MLARAMGRHNSQIAEVISPAARRTTGFPAQRKCQKRDIGQDSGGADIVIMPNLDNINAAAADADDMSAARNFRAATPTGQGPMTAVELIRRPKQTRPRILWAITVRTAPPLAIKAFRF